ncbi:MAG: hypothetical protein KAU20_05020 [Nanoarchaeota archaeon]|nr:hypothetical protein [Nanoarchaeota archaeon]
MISYTEGSIIGVPTKSPTGQNPVIFINTYSGAGVTEHPEGEWSEVDLTGIVPEGTKSVRLDGILLITQGTTAESADLTVAFRAVGETYNYTYNMQCIEASIGNGQRSNAGTFVAVDDDLCFEMKWNRSTQGQYPLHCSYGINLGLTAYIR